MRDDSQRSARVSPASTTARPAMTRAIVTTVEAGAALVIAEITRPARTGVATPITADAVARVRNTASIRW